MNAETWSSTCLSHAVGDRPPAIADVGAGELEPPQQAGGVDAVERLAVGELGRGEAVVVGDNFFEAAQFDQKGARCQPLCPAMKCAGRQLARVDLRKAIPSSCRLAVSNTWASACVAQPSAGLPASASRPTVLGAAEFARFLEAESVGAEEEAGQRIAALPGRQHARHGIADGERVAVKEMGVLDQPQRKRVGRMVGEEVVPDLLAVEGAASRPGLGGGEMAAFALRRAADRRLGRGERVRHFGMIAAKAADQEQIGDRDRAERKGRVGRQRALQPADRIAGQAPIVGDGAIERRRRFGRAGERQALLVFGHCQTPRLRAVRRHDNAATPAAKIGAPLRRPTAARSAARRRCGSTG